MVKWSLTPGTNGVAGDWGPGAIVYGGSSCLRGWKHLGADRANFTVFNQLWSGPEFEVFGVLDCTLQDGWNGSIYDELADRHSVGFSLHLIPTALISPQKAPCYIAPGSCRQGPQFWEHFSSTTLVRAGGLSCSIGSTGLMAHSLWVFKEQISWGLSAALTFLLCLPCQCPGMVYSQSRDWAAGFVGWLSFGS